MKIKWIATVFLIGSATLSMGAQNTRYDDPDVLYAALRSRPHTRLDIGGGQLDVVFADGTPGLDRARILKWIGRSAGAVTTYFGRFPVAHVGILVMAADGAGVGSGATFGFDGSAIRIAVGRDSSDATLADDWVLVHEMTHLALPTVPRRSDWLLEGNATYVEPIARAQAGQLDAAEVWRWSIEGMPKGLPQAGDQGLDHTPTWGRIYWGGALFWLQADVNIRRETHNRIGVQQALRAITAASGGNGARWTVEQVLEAGDRATQTHVLEALYAEEKATPMPIELPGLFRELGVDEQGGKVVFDDHAPLADIRRAITTRPDSGPAP